MGLAKTVELEKAVQNLSQAIRFRTVSDPDPARVDSSAFAAFHTFLQETFPKVHGALLKEIVNDYSLLYTWKGSDETLKPILLMAHLDVVPVEEGTEQEWHSPPFEGKIADGFIWGRGALDDKVSLMGIMEAVESLLAQGSTPRRTVYLAFGHDEEVRGVRGAMYMAALLKSRGVHAEYVLDETGCITKGVVPGVPKPVALVGTAEKGYLTLELSVEGEGGHSSMPPPKTAIGILSSAIDSLERNPFPARLVGPTAQMLEAVGPEMGFPMRLVFANQWLFKGLIKRRLERSAYTTGAVRTTCAATVIRGGERENVLPQKATALVNFRLFPGDSAERVIRRVERTVRDARVKIAILGEDYSEASRIADRKSSGFKILEKSIKQVFPDCVVAPYLVMATADARHYQEISDCVLRFLPTRMTPDDFKRLHGTNERVSIENYEEIIRFYVQLILNS
jgi:carboxypeptidase PM20D1